MNRDLDGRRVARDRKTLLDAAPGLPGWKFTVSGDGPFVLECQVSGNKTSLVANSANSPKAGWEALVQQYLKLYHP